MTRAHRSLAIAALVLGVGAALAGPRGGNGHIDVGQLARAVAREDDHVTAIELAQWIKSRRANLRIIDLRSESDFDSLNIPGAQHAAIDTLDRIRFSPRETIVLYSEGGAHSAQAWVFLRALGNANVFFLRGGIQEWIEDVIVPGLAVDATDAERERFTKASELSRYFGGTPRLGVTRDEKAETIARMKRRGC